MYNSQTKTKSDTIVYMDSRDSLLTSGGDAKITHILKEPIVKRDNEMIITSLYNLQVPYSFYNITPHNNTLCFQYGTTLCMYDDNIMNQANSFWSNVFVGVDKYSRLLFYYYKNLSIRLDVGNYNVSELISALESKINAKLASIHTIRDLTDWHENYVRPNIQNTNVA